MVRRILWLSVTTILSVVLIWKGNSGAATETGGMVTPVMAVFAGLCLFFTGLAVFLRVDGDFESLDHEPTASIDEAATAEEVRPRW